MAVVPIAPWRFTWAVEGAGGSAEQGSEKEHRADLARTTTGVLCSEGRSVGEVGGSQLWEGKGKSSASKENRRPTPPSRGRRVNGDDPSTGEFDGNEAEWRFIGGLGGTKVALPRMGEGAPRPDPGTSSMDPVKEARGGRTRQYTCTCTSRFLR